MTGLLDSLGSGSGKYPTLGFDPAPGNPGNVSALAANLTGTAGTLREAKGTLAAVAGNLGGWEGQAAESFRSRASEFPKQLDQAAAAMTGAAGVLRQWQQDLVRLQAKARAYEQQAAAAKKKVEAAENDPALSLIGQFFSNDMDLAAAQEKSAAAKRRLAAAREEFEEIIARAKKLLEYHEELSGETARKLTQFAESAPAPGLLTAFLDDLGAPFEAGWNWTKAHANRIANLGDISGDIAMGTGILSLLSIGAGGLLVSTGIGAPLGGALVTIGTGGLGASTLFGFGALGLHGVAKLSGGDVSAEDLVFDVANAVSFGLGQMLQPALAGLDDVGRAMHEAFFEGSWQSTSNSLQQESIAQHADDYWRDGWWNIPAAMERAWSLGAGEDSAAQQEAAEQLKEAKKAVGR